LDYVWILISVKNKVKMIVTGEKLGWNNKIAALIIYNRISESVFQSNFVFWIPKYLNIRKMFSEKINLLENIFRKIVNFGKRFPNIMRVKLEF
jgi:hypothetical protein